MGLFIRDIMAVLPNNGAFETVNTCVRVENDLIAAVNPQAQPLDTDTLINGAGKLLIPGLVNSHTHVYMSLFRNYADDLSFMDWLFKNILPLEDKLLPDDSYWGTMLGYMEMLKTGTTCSLDMYITPDQAAQAQHECGIRAVMSRGLSGSYDDESGGIRRITEATNEIRKWQYSENLSFMLGPHAPYTCDPAYLKEILACATELNVGLNVHISESLDEINTIRERYGCTPVEMMDNCGLLRDTTVAAHCVHLSDNDIQILADRSVSVATNPISNMKLGNGFAPIPKLLEKGVNVCLGTDSAASNNSLNIFRDLACLTLIHKAVCGDARVISAAQGFGMATVNGAKALGLGGITGEIRVGMKADLVIMDTDKPWMKPDINPLAALCYSATGTEVETVIVNGKILLKNNEFTTIDSERVYFETERICRRLGMI